MQSLTGRRSFLCLALTLLITGSSIASESRRPELLVFAAASLTNALEEIGAMYTNSTGQVVKFSFAASSTLAKQIEAGARSDVFISADREWADYLQDRKLLNAASRTNLLGNRLVLIAPADSRTQLKISAGMALASALGAGRLSVGDPAAVPAGKYARTALTRLGVWNSVANKLALGDSVRTTLNFVSRGEAPLGIVYATDALIDKNVRVVDVFPENSHEAIVYPVALTSSAAADASRFLQFLHGAMARNIFVKYGFTPP